MFGVNTDRLRKDLRSGDEGSIRRRRAIVGVSLAGISSMAAISLLQMGLIKRLPNPNTPSIDSNKAALSDEAYALGTPDGPLAVTTLAANLPIAAFGEADRARTMPVVPLAAAAKALLDTSASAFYFYTMRYKIKTWCIYCMLGSIANLGVLALTIPEAIEAIKSLNKSKH